MSHEIGDADMESSDDGSVFVEDNTGTDVFVTFEDGDPVHLDVVDTGFRFVPSTTEKEILWPGPDWAATYNRRK